eukprot:COSAG02_NODE_4212_length_5624_cov_12.618281_1_plen_163_part_00
MTANPKFLPFVGSRRRRRERDDASRAERARSQTKRPAAYTVAWFASVPSAATRRLRILKGGRGGGGGGLVPHVVARWSAPLSGMGMGRSSAARAAWNDLPVCLSAGESELLPLTCGALLTYTACPLRGDSSSSLHNFRRFAQGVVQRDRQVLQSSLGGSDSF